MTFSEPVLGQGGTYLALFVSSPDLVDSSARFDVTMNVGEEEWTQEALNDLFQEMVDTIAANPKFSFLLGRWNSGASSTITPTPPPAEG